MEINGTKGERGLQLYQGRKPRYLFAVLQLRTVVESRHWLFLEVSGSTKRLNGLGLGEKRALQLGCGILIGLFVS